MEFGPDGYFYCATGDGGENDPTNAGADLRVLKGKILRLDVDGADDIPGNADDDTIADPNRNYSIPPDNPFVTTPMAMGEIWHYGVRNAWRNSFDTATGDLYIADVGQLQREEVSFASAGVDGLFFGWRCWEGTLNTGLGCGTPPDPPTWPIHEYNHSVGISITGGYVYRGCSLPGIEGTYFFGDWSGGKIFSFRYDTVHGLVDLRDRTSTLGGGGGLTSFGTDAYGEIYYTRGSEVRKIVPAVFVGPDCNANSRRDACDIADGGSDDTNGNAVPDECECIAEAEVCDGLDNDCNDTVDDAPVPDGSPLVTVEPVGGEMLLSWTTIASASAYDVVRGGLNALRASGGDFTAAVDLCVDDDRSATTMAIAEPASPGDGYFYLVRPVNCGGAGTYDSGSQVGSRDGEIDAAAEACP
jgi:hypothetical protein